jgi:hypothetical protein
LRDWLLFFLSSMTGDSPGARKKPREEAALSVCVCVCVCFLYSSSSSPGNSNRERDEREREIYNERNQGSTMGAMASYSSRSLSNWSLPRQTSVTLLYCFGCHFSHQSSSFYHGMEASP